MLPPRFSKHITQSRSLHPKSKASFSFLVLRRQGRYPTSYSKQANSRLRRRQFIILLKLSRESKLSGPPESRPICKIVILRRVNKDQNPMGIGNGALCNVIP